MQKKSQKRYITKIPTEDGEVRVKHVSGYGISREKIEYEDLSKIALKNDISLFEARKLVTESKTKQFKLSNIGC